VHEASIFGIIWNGAHLAEQFRKLTSISTSGPPKRDGSRKRLRAVANDSVYNYDVA
jgi:hypothetical protein